MPKYKFEWDQPLSLPEYGIEAVFPGEVVDSGDQEVNHPGFKLLKKAEVKELEKAEVAPAVKPAEEKKG